MWLGDYEHYIVKRGCNALLSMLNSVSRVPYSEHRQSYDGI